MCITLFMLFIKFFKTPFFIIVELLIQLEEIIFFIYKQGKED